MDKRDRRLLQAASANGHLDPVFRRIESEIGKAERPLMPEGAEWPNKRAFMDGQSFGLLELLGWLKMASKPSPDEAQNTED